MDLFKPKDFTIFGIAGFQDRMDAIRKTKTMAGSPDADLAKAISVSQSWHGLCVFGRRSLVNL